MLKKLQYLYQCYFPHYEFSMNHEKNLNEAYQLLDRVFVEELGRESEDENDRPSADKQADVGIVTIKSTRIIAALQSFSASHIADAPAKQKSYGIHHIPNELWLRTICHSHLAVQQDYRHSWMGLHLLRHCYDYYIHQGMLISVAYCIPKLYSLYSALGYKIMSQPENTMFGCRIPIGLITFDKQHLKAKHSPFYKICQHYSGWQINAKDTELIEEYKQRASVAENFMALLRLSEPRKAV